MSNVAQFSLEDLVEGNSSDQLRETVEQVNLKLKSGTISLDKAKGFVATALIYEIHMRYYDFPLEDGSPQTLELETRKFSLQSQK